MQAVAWCAGRRRCAVGASALLGLVMLAALVGTVTTLVSVRAADDPIAPPTLSATDYHAILESCAPAWNPGDRNIYTRDGLSLNDVDQATRTSFVTVWQVDAWPRWRWEAECLGTVFTLSAGATSSRQATLDPPAGPPINSSGLPTGDYRELLDNCAPAWNPADRNIYTRDGLSLNDVDQATRTSFVTVWQVDAWPRWRWEAECLGTVFTLSAGATSSRQATLDPPAGPPINSSGLPTGDYRELLDNCAPAWNPADRNIYTRDGYSLNDVDRATRTSFVTVWQVDAWPRWRWEAECLGTAFTLSAGATSSRQATLNPTSAPTINPSSLSVADYHELLDRCAPTWDPTDRNIYTRDGLSLNDVDRATRTSFVTVWQVDAWPRWRWEVNCLQGATGNAPETAPRGWTTILGTVRATYDPLTHRVCQSRSTSRSSVTARRPGTRRTAMFTRRTA